MFIGYYIYMFKTHFPTSSFLLLFVATDSHIWDKIELLLLCMILDSFYLIAQISEKKDRHLSTIRLNIPKKEFIFSQQLICCAAEQLMGHFQLCLS